MPIALLASLSVTLLAIGLRQTVQEEIVCLGSTTIALIGFLISLILAPLWLQVGILLVPFIFNRFNPLWQ